MKMPADYLTLIKNDPHLDQIRAFIAIELSEDVKNRLRALQDILKAVDPGCAKWVSPDSIHLTLKFLGNTPVGKLDNIVQVMEKTARDATSFQIEITGLGAFPNLKRVQIVWVGVSGKVEQLLSLQKDLDAGLAKLGFPRENRTFIPHLTLARIRDYVSADGRQALGEAINGSRTAPHSIIGVDSFSLIRSQLTRAGAIYTRLYSVELKPPCH
jgi:2'-5' RNA ligase